MMKQLVSSAKVNFSSWNVPFAAVSQIKVPHWPKAPCWWDLITYTQCTDTAERALRTCVAEGFNWPDSGLSDF